MNRYSMKPTLAYDNNGFDRTDVSDDNFAGGKLHVQRGSSKQVGPLARVFLPLSIMAIECFERMAYYTITAGILYFSVLNLNYNIQSGGLMILSTFSSAVYLSAPLGGLIADAFLGRFYTILLSAILYIAGLAVLVTGSFDSSKLNMEDFDLEQRNIMTLAGLGMIGLATGGIKANAAPFGADQVRSLGDKTLTSYFNLYYFVINIGSVSAVMGLVHLQTEMYIGSSLLVPLTGMTVSLLFFAGMHGLYLKYRPERHSILQIMCQGCSKCTYEGTCFAGAMERFGGSKPDRVVIGFSSAFKTGLLSNFMIFVWLGISMLSLASPFQSDRMDRYVGSFEVPDYVYRAFRLIAVLLAIPFLALGVLPLFRDRGRFSLTVTRRLGLGLFFIALGLLATGVVEKLRKNTLEKGEFTVKRFQPSEFILNYSSTNPMALEITKNVTGDEVSALLNLTAIKRDNSSTLDNFQTSSQRGGDSVAPGVQGGKDPSDQNATANGENLSGSASEPPESETYYSEEAADKVKDSQAQTNQSVISVKNAANLIDIQVKAILANASTDFKLLMNTSYPSLKSTINSLKPDLQQILEHALPQLVQLLANMSLEDAESIMNMLPQALTSIDSISPLLQKSLVGIFPQLLPQLVEIPPQNRTLIAKKLPEILNLISKNSVDEQRSLINMLPHLLPLMANLSSEMLPPLLGMLPQMLPFLTNLPPQMQQSLMGMLSQMSSSPDALKSLVGMLPQMLPLMANLSSEMLPPLLEMLPQMLRQLAKLPPQMQQSLMSMLSQMSSSPDALESLVGMLPQMLPLLTKVPSEMLPMLMGMLPQVLEVTKGIPPKDLLSMMKMLPELLSQMGSQMNSIPTELRSSFMKMIPSLLPVLARTPPQEILTTINTLMGSIQEKAGRRIAVHLVLNTPDGFPLWELRAPLNVSNMSVFTQIPQFMLVGIGEALAAVAGLQLAYHQAPFPFQGFTTGLFVMTMGAGTFTAGSLIQLIDSLTEVCDSWGLCAGTWFSPAGGDINSQNMHYMMFLLASLAGFAFLLYLLVTFFLYGPVDPMSFAEFEESELPGIELKGTASGNTRSSNNGYSLAH
ncbi:hypothetical protein RRG08_056292 [Elysia crispata]|uniref:Uncharacterized protein n=1 Tax=Elysia crispata TaxID=231223 RepID=A0AAE1AWK7_9GAST|nr:hypothetical protein RRG08_056292 [Elysia crispata]